MRLLVGAAIALLSLRGFAAEGRVADVQLQWSDESWGRTDFSGITSKFKGGDASAERARELLRELSRTGRVSGVEVLREETSEGIRWRVKVEPRRIVERVDISPAPSVALDAAVPEVDADVTPADLRSIETAIRLAYRQAAFVGTRAKVRIYPGKKDGYVRLQVDLVEGERRALSKVSFTVHGASAPELRPYLKFYPVTRGDIPIPTALDEADRALENAMQQEGYVNVAVTHSVSGSDTESVLRVSVTPGLRSIWSFEGNLAFDDGALRGVIDESTDKSPGNLADRIRNFYTKHGYADADVVHELRAMNGNKTSTRFRIREGAIVKALEPEVLCLDESALKGVDNAPTDRAGVIREIGSYLREELPHTGLLAGGNEENARALTTGTGATPLPSPDSPEPEATYDEATYDKAIEHLRDLYRAEGFLSVRVGPIERARASCSSLDSRGQCVVDMASLPPARACTRDVHGFPVAPKDTGDARTCVPDIARGQHCAPQITLRLPIDLGPRTYVSDVLVEGAHSAPPADIIKVTEVKLGEPLSAADAEAARTRVRDYYRERGFAYARVDWRGEFSIDGTRARLRFDVWEGEQVQVSEIVIRGNRHTNEALVRKRIALTVGGIYKTSLIRQTQEQISTLGVFNAVDVDLENPDSPESKKRIIVSVRERPRWLFEPFGGFSTGEGFRLGGEVAYRNLFGEAISFSASASAAYLPTIFILDDTVRSNFSSLGEPGFGLEKRIAARLSAGLQFPDIGLGPTVRGNLDGLFVNDLQRDYRVSKLTAGPSIGWRLSRQLQLTAGPTIERNSSRIFNGLTRDELVALQQGLGLSDGGAASRALLVPDGESLVFAQKVGMTFDGRDQSLNPTKGFYLALNAEHVDASPILNEAGIAAGTVVPPTCLKEGTCDSHFFKLSGSASTYIKLRGRLRLALQMRAGVNIQLTDKSSSYPDRLFFMGGSDSMRAWLPSAMIPQDVADQVNGINCAESATATTNCNLLLAGIRGGNLMLNPRAELRIPLSGIVETVLFVDAGNLWKDPAKYPWASGSWKMRYSLGTGLRFDTPVFPIAVDFGFNPDPYRWEKLDWMPIPLGAAFNFAIGLY